jgi:Ni2+-binding GTPase involved in maturation of urease and hydrogenase
MQSGNGQSHGTSGPRIAVVGPCASGKTTLVGNLLRQGVEAWAVSQEHSGVQQLWARRSPDMLVALDVSLEVLRTRRSPEWSAAIYVAQHERLRDAFANADVLLDTGELSEEAVLAEVMALVDDFRHSSPPS